MSHLQFIKKCAAICALILFISPFLFNDIVQPQKSAHIPSYLDKFNRSVILCHRGSRYMGPENSVHMHQMALAMGCDVLEFDVRLTKDRELVIHHDPTIDRTTDYKGLISDFSVIELQLVDSAYQYTPKGPGKSPYSAADFPYRGLGYHISTLRNFLNIFKDANKNIEIKDPGVLGAEKLWQELQLHQNDWQNIIVASSHCDALRHFRKISNHQIATSACETEALLFFTTHMIGIGNFWYWLFPSSAIVYQAPTVSSGIYLREKRFVDAAHRLGQRLMYWVINDGQIALELLDLGADGIVSDRTDIIYSAFHSRGLVSPSLEERLQGMKINNSETFFIPESNPQEIHTCVSFSCQALPLVLHNFTTILAVIASILMIIVVRMVVVREVADDAHRNAKDIAWSESLRHKKKED